MDTDRGLARDGIDGAAPRAADDDPLRTAERGEALFALWYLLFAYVPLLFWRGWTAWTLGATLAATAVFVVLHFDFDRRGPRLRRLYIACAAALGLALVVWNPGGNTFVIYAVAMAGLALPARRAVATGAVLLALLAGMYFWRYPHGLALTYAAMTAVIAALVLGGVIAQRERDRRLADLRLSREEVARLAAMAERERIGRDLHDLLGHTLSVVALKSELAGRLLERDVGAARAQIAEVEQVARSALAQVREAVAGIRASGLEAELAAARLALLSADMRLDQRLAPMALTPAAESALALALREAVTNVLRHSGASRVEVELTSEAGHPRLLVADDGRGGLAREGHGLAGMRERLAAVGGRVEVDSPAGGGTRLQFVLPASAREASA